MKTKDQQCLEFLSDKMEATARMVGEHLIGKHTSYATRCGAAILGRLREHGLVTRLPELNAWRNTKSGREHLTRSNGAIKLPGGE
jgi:hypothetical protein